MKKLLLLFAALVMFTACNDDDNFHLDRVIRDFNIPSSAWKFDNNIDGPYWYRSENFRELDGFKYDNGTLVVYLERTLDDGERVQYPLPYVRSLEDGGGTYTETIDYAYSDRGVITFFFTRSDFYYGYPDPLPPVSMKFRAVILY